MVRHKRQVRIETRSCTEMHSRMRHDRRRFHTCTASSLVSSASSEKVNQQRATAMEINRKSRHAGGTRRERREMAANWWRWSTRKRVAANNDEPRIIARRCGDDVFRQTFLLFPVLRPSCCTVALKRKSKFTLKVGRAKNIRLSRGKLPGTVHSFVTRGGGNQPRRSTRRQRENSRATTYPETRGNLFADYV